MDLRSLFVMLCLFSLFEVKKAQVKDLLDFFNDYEVEQEWEAEDIPKPVVSVSPQSWVTEGDSVTLSCEVNDSSTNWTFTWYRVALTSFHHLFDQEEPLSNSSRGSGVSYTLSPAALHHSGVYKCEVKRGESYFHTESVEQPLWITGQSPPVSLIMSPTRTQHFTGESLSLSCVSESNSAEWELRRYTPHESISNMLRYLDWELLSVPFIYNISSLDPSDTGVYWCVSDSGDSGNPVNITVHETDVILDSPVHPVTEGDPLTLRCLYRYTNSSNHASDFYKDGSILQSQTTGEITIGAVSRSDEGFYYCKHSVGGMSPKSWVLVRGLFSLFEVKKAQDIPKPVVSVSPQSWVTEGDSVTLSCEVNDSSTNWTFTWYRVVLVLHLFNHEEPLSNSSRGSGLSYTLSPAALHHSGVYTCEVKRGESYLHTESVEQPLWITGQSPPVSLIMSPTRTQHFTGESLSLSCVSESNSTKWKLRRYTPHESISGMLQYLDWELLPVLFIYNISSLDPSDTGVYWCVSNSGDSGNPVNITVHETDVILDSPVHPVTAGDPLTLRCLYRYTNSSNHASDFYKDGSILQSQTTGEITISAVSRSDEGFYYCKHSVGGMSPKSWVSVRVSHQSHSSLSVLKMIGFALAASPYLLSTIILLVKYYRARVHTDED